MWRLNKPSLISAKSDFDNAFPRGNNVNIDLDRNSVMDIYDKYDLRNGCSHNDYKGNMCHKETKSKLKNAYNKTYPGKELSYIRTDLFENVHKCPVCSIAAPSELDHFLPQADYDLLSINRQNLIPSCHICNNNKRCQNGDTFVHAYYANFPDDYFFTTEIDIVNNSMVFNFVIKEKAFGINKDLYRRVVNQVDRVKLKDRLSKEIDGFIFEIFDLNELNDENYSALLDRVIRKYCISHGKNDWRTSFLMGMKANNAINSELINRIIEKYRPNPVVI